MSDDMTTHKRGRRGIRRLTRRKIPLPTASPSHPSESAQLELTATDGDASEARPTNAPEANGAIEVNGDATEVATNLAELRIPGDDASEAAGEAAADGGDSIKVSIAPEAADEAVSAAAEAPREAAAGSESIEEEPTTNPHIRIGEALGTAAGGASNGAAAHAAAASETPGANGAAAESSSAVAAAEDESEFEPVTGQHLKPAPASSAPLRKPDSDAPTRPRIELSTEMALAAGRVTSLEVPPVRSEQPPRRGSKLPPPGGERVVSSLTGRRSSAFPPSTDEDDAAARPAVIVTRSRIISDRPPRAHESDSIKSARLERESAKRDAIEPPKRPTLETDKRVAADASKAQPTDVRREAPDREAPDEDLVATGESEIPEPETSEIVKVDAPEPALPSLRPSRKPAAEGDDFETLDIEESEVETHSIRAEAEIDAEFDEDEPAKAPPPPPQQKRAAVPPAPVAPPKAAPPPPPRVGTGPVPITTASAGVATSMPAPTMPATATPAAAVAAAAPNSAAGGVPRKSGTRPQPRRRQWWETLFSDDYLRTVVRPTSQQIARQVDFMQASLGVTKGSAVLDVGCGLGQHALEFARRQCLVVALDLALPMITRAAEDAQQEGLRINFLHKDIRDIGFEGTFDAVVCVGTTFGFFDDEQNREVLGRLANALKPGGRLLLEVVNRDHVLPSQPNLQWFEGDGCVVMEESDFNYYSSRLTVKRTMMREDGRQTESEYSIRLYALHELGQMMQAAGFRVKEVSGGQATRGVFFGAHSSRIILLAERRTPAQPRGNNGHASDAPGSAES